MGLLKIGFSLFFMNQSDPCIKHSVSSLCCFRISGVSPFSDSLFSECGEIYLLKDQVLEDQHGNELYAQVIKSLWREDLRQGDDQAG